MPGGDGFRISEAYIEVTTRDNTEAGRAAFEAHFRNLHAQAKVDIDIAGVDAKIERVRQKLQEIENRRTDPRIDADITAARAKFAEVEAKIDELRSRPATVQTDADI